eukprot:TRINITY_DN21662_c0_g1_i1.p3 TRINITY_DN21662_c0_g1~~TRINITY_DN21662_c0_g1_i1.p3  ORF type:complete len:111 (-),score=10.28 TRINITY_DN21662_c0_g1_i1:93-425(-)
MQVCFYSKFDFSAFSLFDKNCQKFFCVRQVPRYVWLRERKELLYFYTLYVLQIFYFYFVLMKERIQLTLVQINKQIGIERNAEQLFQVVHLLFLIFNFQFERMLVEQFQQ